jgi:hypothetical protein
VTFVWGEHDAFDTPDRGRQLAAATVRPGEVIVIPDAGHLPWIDEPELVARAILSAVSTKSTGQRPEREAQRADRVSVVSAEAHAWLVRLTGDLPHRCSTDALLDT